MERSIMDGDVKRIVTECTAGSDAARLTFPEVVMRLMRAGVERYHADLVRAEKTYYMPGGASHAVPSAKLRAAPARDFSAAGVDAAVRAIQAQNIDYAEFCERIAAAGCVGYIVSLVGRRAVYFGRTGENHLEPFPPAK